MCLLVAALVLALLVVLGDFSASLPALASVRGLNVPLALITPLALSTMLGHALTRGDPSLESVSVRPVGVFDTALLAVTATGFLVAAACADLSGHAAYGLEAGRNAIGFVGLLLIGRSFFGQNAATAAPVLAVVLLAFFGADAAGEPRWWAWAMVDADQAGSWLAALSLGCIGIVLSLIVSSRGRLISSLTALLARLRKDTPATRRRWRSRSY